MYFYELYKLHTVFYQYLKYKPFPVFLYPSLCVQPEAVIIPCLQPQEITHLFSITAAYSCIFQNFI